MTIYKESSEEFESIYCIRKNKEFWQLSKEIGGVSWQCWPALLGSKVTGLGWWSTLDYRVTKATTGTTVGKTILLSQGEPKECLNLNK
ncbi:hypothetical protein Pcinc_040737 [Petrolisthes cinctipes]|uniref:Uncharacterized protein n=1 Tax=Petrolisthes cinctipes TaxID=88211 RepID=A0AAE1EJ59_PETCI|nr:hypothetical protein Pcinc_040737 [Petrolisthes cinctipes]